MTPEILTHRGYIYRINSTCRMSFFLIIFTAIGSIGHIARGELQPSRYKINSVLDIAKVWAGHPVGFYLLTYSQRQFVAFYDDDRQMTVASRQLGQNSWQLYRLPEKIGWDSHNYIVMAVDSEGYIHLSGNMHCTKLVYFRTEKPLDITTFKRIRHMTGANEQRCTYPRFFHGPGREFIFTYRDGSSGNGNQIYNIYNHKRQSWRRLLDKPLTDGRGQMNAYLQGPAKGPDGYYHLCWVWRDTPDCATNHTLSYARSRDLVHWENVLGTPLKLPITIDSPVVVDPVPAGGGIINGNTITGFDSRNRPIISYHKYDANGKTQIFNARFEQGHWKIYQTSNWDYRWDFHGGGSIPFEIHVYPVKVRVIQGGKHLVQKYYNKKYGSGTWILDEKDLAIIGKPTEPPLYPTTITKVRSKYPGMQANLRGDAGKSPTTDTRYLIRWESLDRNRDRARKGPLPAPSFLQLYEMKLRSALDDSTK